MGMPSKTKTIAATLGALLLVLCIAQGEFFIPHALADDKVITDTQGGIMQTLLVAVGVLNFASFLTMKFIGWLAEPGNIYAIGNEGMMLRLWQISRDIMNLIFAILLLIAAIMTIVFADRKFTSKETIVKYLLAVVLVNFSWFFPRVIIDIANVSTATVYSLPKTINSTCKWRDGAGVAQDCNVITNIKLFPSGASGFCPPTTAGSSIDLSPIMMVCLEPLDANTNTAFGIINGMVVNHGRLMHLGLIVGSPPAGGTGATAGETLRFTIVMAFVTFLHVMLAFPLIAMALIMIVRLPILWLTISFMPFMFIGFLIGNKFIKVDTMEIFTKHFMTAAFLPTLIAIPFSIGYIMLNEITRISSTTGFVPPAGLGESFPLIAEVKDWWQVIWIVLAFMVIWMGSFWAMKSDSIYAKFSEPVHNIGSNILKLPLIAPVIPHDISGDDKISKGEGIGVSTLLRSLQSESGVSKLVFGGGGGGGGGRGNGVTAQSPQLLNALNAINSTTADKMGDVSHSIELLDEHLRIRGIDPRDQGAVKSALPSIMSELRSAIPGSNVTIDNLDDFAAKFVKAPRPARNTP